MAQTRIPDALLNAVGEALGQTRVDLRAEHAAALAELRGEHAASMAALRAELGLPPTAARARRSRTYSLKD